MEVAHSALPVTLAPWERAGVRETGMAAATYILWGGADAMAVSGGSPVKGCLDELREANRTGVVAERGTGSVEAVDVREKRPEREQQF
jgi:hypothetical protein